MRYIDVDDRCPLEHSGFGRDVIRGSRKAQALSWDEEHRDRALAGSWKRSRGAWWWGRRWSSRLGVSVGECCPQQESYC